jgi:protein-S-isoprenylcysteine O-methyltransferase Ste14
MVRVQRGDGGSGTVSMVSGDSVGTGILRFSVALHCIWDFGWTGRGTPAPVVPPRRLVVVGSYRYVRNPMYLGFAVGWIGLWIVFGHPNPTASAALVAVAVGVHPFVVLYEEPTLRKKFGVDYARGFQECAPLVAARAALEPSHSFLGVAYCVGFPFPATSKQLP